MKEKRIIMLLALTAMLAVLCTSLTSAENAFAANNSRVIKISFSKKGYYIPDKTKKKIKVKITVQARGKNGIKGKTKKKIKWSSLKAGKLKIRWKTSNKKIATVKKGVVTAKKRGKCTIYAQAGKYKCKTKIYVKTNPKVPAEDVPILTFHRIMPDKVKRKKKYSKYQWDGAVSDFEAQLKYLKDHGYITVSLDQFYDWYYGKTDLPENAVVLTIDDGYYETYHLMYPIIKKYGFKATAFIVGKETRETTPPYTTSETEDMRIGLDVMEKTRKEYPDLDYQSHSYDLHWYDDSRVPVVHASRLKTKEEIVEDFAKNEKFGFKYFAYPFGVVTPELKQVAENSYIKMAFGFRDYDYARRSDDPYEIKRLKVSGQITLRKFAKILDRY